MSRFLFTTLPTNDLGLPTRALPIAQALSRLGHTVIFSSPARAPARLIAQAGFENRAPVHPLYDLVRFRPRLSGLRQMVTQASRYPRGVRRYVTDLLFSLPLRSAPRTLEVWNMGHAGAMLGMLNERFVRANCTAMRDLIGAVSADVVVDFWNPFAAIAARALGVPLVTVIQADAHPAGKGFIWWKPTPASVPNPTPVVNRIRSEFGLRAIDQLEELSVGDLTLVVGMPESDPLVGTPDVAYIGSVLWEPAERALPAWIDALPPSQKLIWVYTGNPRYSQGNDALGSMVLLKAAIRALADADLAVVLTTGYQPLPRDVLPLPANIRHEPYLPGPALAARADLLIHHGGYGSCQTGLDAGTPAVIVPTYAERESNARRVQALGAGVIVPVDIRTGRKRVDVDQLRAAVGRVLADPRYAARAQEAGHRLRALGGAPRAARLIDEFAAALTPSKAASG